MASVLKETPSAQSIVKKGKDRDGRFIYLAKHMVEKAIAKDALILANDGLGIAILFEVNAKDKNSFKDWIEELKLVRHVIGIKNALKIVKNQGYIKKMRPKKGNYLYCWFWGIVKETRGAERQIAAEMKDNLIRISEEKQLPIYAETRVRTNAVVYNRYKFSIYHTWDHPSGDKMWFVKYTPKSLRKAD